MPTADYCREVEAYLCRKNDGHLIRIVGPSFDLVSRWQADGVPLKIVLRGVDRYFERYYRKGPRRRPVRIDFCEADVLDAFDEWRRAVLHVGHANGGAVSGVSDVSSTLRSGVHSAVEAGAPRRAPSLPAHLERALVKLTGARATGKLGAETDLLIDRVSFELDAARASARGLRGTARQSLVARLEAIDEELLLAVRATLDEAARLALQKEAEEELAGFRASMKDAAYNRAREAAINRLVRDQFGLPSLAM